MSYRNLPYRDLLFAALCLAGSGVAIWAGLVEGIGQDDRATGRMMSALTLLGIVGCFCFLVRAFRPDPLDELIRTLPPTRIRLFPSPEAAFEFSAGEDAPGTGAAVTAEAVRASLTAGKGFTVAADPDGWLVLTGTIGSPRWVKDDKGELVAKTQYARLRLRSGADATALRPEDVALVSTDTNLTVNASFALAAAFGPLRIRIRSDDQWFAVVPETLFAFLAIRLAQTRPSLVPFQIPGPSGD